MMKIYEGYSDRAWWVDGHMVFARHFKFGNVHVTRSHLHTNTYTLWL